MQRIVPLTLVGTILLVLLSHIGWAQQSVYFSHKTLTVYPNINEKQSVARLYPRGSRGI